MGNQRFRLSDIMPNAWFYKLRDMANQKKPTIKNSSSSTSSSSSSFTSYSSSSFSSSSSSIPNRHRKSYHFSRQPKKENILPPRKSTRRRIGPPPDSSSPDLFPHSLHPIITKKPQSPVEGKVLPLRPSSASGVKLRSPRIGMRTVVARKNTPRRGVAQSFPVVKSSRDPRRDFRESMVEMILENNLTESKDFEQLLACYLALNSDEYHDLIINVFKQIWIEFVRSSKLVV